MSLRSRLLLPDTWIPSLAKASLMSLGFLARIAAIFCSISLISSLVTAFFWMRTFLAVFLTPFVGRYFGASGPSWVS